VTTHAGLSGLTTNTGEHGFTAILFAYTSCIANNGQAFASLNANTSFYNVTTAIAMFMGRFAHAIPALALAGFFARQKQAPTTAGTVPTDSFIFGLLLSACLVILTALSYLPALALGPVLDRLLHGV
jgi:potassium-transporting ATPase potassium-binding subunit